jgi:hypothetical protein
VGVGCRQERLGGKRRTRKPGAGGRACRSVAVSDGWMDAVHVQRLGGWARVRGGRLGGRERELLYAGVQVVGRVGEIKDATGELKREEQGSKGAREQREGRWGPGVRRFRLGPVVGWSREAVPAQSQLTIPLFPAEAGPSPSRLPCPLAVVDPFPARRLGPLSPSPSSPCPPCPRYPPPRAVTATVSTNTNPNTNPNVMMHRLARWLADG